MLKVIAEAHGGPTFFKGGKAFGVGSQVPQKPAPTVVAFPKGQVRLINNDHFTCHARCILPTYGINFRNAQAPSGCKPQVKPLEQRRKKSSKRTRSRADEGTGNNVARKVHAAEDAADRKHDSRNQQHDGNGRAGRKPTCRDGEGREGMTARERLARAIASNERRDGAALVGPGRVEPPPEETHCGEPAVTPTRGASFHGSLTQAHPSNSA